MKLVKQKAKEVQFEYEKIRFLKHFPHWEELIGFLPYKQQVILKQRYGLAEYSDLTVQPTLTAIAKELNVTRQAVQNAALRGLENLERAEAKKELLRKILVS